MSDLIELRDHSQPCEHPVEIDENGINYGAYPMFKEGPWVCGDGDGCPGGKKIVMRQTTIKDMRLKADTPIWVEVSDE